MTTDAPAPRPDLPPDREPDGPLDDRPSPRRRWPIVAALVFIASSGLAAGLGISPSDAIDAIRDAVRGEPELDEVLAVVVAADAVGPERVELRVGPTTDGDGECRLVRTLSAVGGISDTEAVCVDGSLLAWADPRYTPGRPSEHFGFVVESPIGSVETGFDSVALSGAVHPAVTAMTARFGDASEYSFVPSHPDGWFAVILPSGIADIDRSDGRLVNGLIELELFDAEGRILATVNVPAWVAAEGGR